MCQETVTLAICAPQDSPVLSVTCGKLHMIAAQRDVCNEARGPCVCYFGTCGSVAKDVNSEAMDFADLAKFPCASCTDHNDGARKRRTGKEIIESLLLKKPAFSLDDETAIRNYYATLRHHWADEHSCPYHENSDVETSSLPHTPSEVASENGAETGAHSVSNADDDAMPDTDVESLREAALQQTPISQSACVDMEREDKPGSSIYASPTDHPKAETGTNANGSAANGSATDHSPNDPAPSHSPPPTRYVPPARDMSEVMENPKALDAIRKISMAKVFLAGEDLV